MTLEAKKNHGQNEIDLLEYFFILKAHGWRILLISFTAAVLSLLITFAMPKIYASKISLLPPQEETIGQNSFNMSAGLGSLASGLGISSSPANIWIGILKSSTVLDAIVQRFGLKEYYGKDTLDDARAALKKAVDIEKTKEDLIMVIVEDKDPAMAAKIAAAFAEELDKVNSEIVMTSGKRTRIFIEKRLNEAKAELREIENEIRSFQEMYKAVKIDDQSKAIISRIGTLKGELMAKEIELQTLLTYATPANPKVQILQSNVNELKAKLQEFEEGNASSHNDIFIPTSKLPELNLKFASMLRDMKVQETLYELLTQQYEMARIQEAKDSPTVQVLDAPKIAERKVKPKRSIIVAFTAIFTAFISSIFFLFRERFARV